MTVLVRVLVAIAAGFLLLGGYLAFAQHRFVTTAVPVTAHVITSERTFTQDKKGNRGEHFSIRYRYDVRGDAHESTALTPSALHITPNIDELLRQFPAGATTTAWVDPANARRAFLLKHHSFIPYLLALIAGPFLALAAGLATGGIRFVRSGETEFPELERGRDGWAHALPFRANAALGWSAYAASAAIAAVSAPVFAHYFFVADPAHPLAVLTALGTGALVMRLYWGGFAKNWSAARLEDASLDVKPEHPVAGKPFTVRVTQLAKSPVTIAAFDVTLVCEQSTMKTVNRKLKTTRRVVVAGRASLPVGRLAGVGEPITVEHTFAVAGDITPTDAVLHWRLVLRTRIPGPDYRTHFALPVR